MSDIQDYVEYIVKKHETLYNNPSFQIYINMINKRLVFKRKDEYKVEMQTPETMKLFGSNKHLSAKQIMDKKYGTLKCLQSF